MRLLALAPLFVACACSSEDPVGGTSESTDSGGATVCDYECFPGRTCVDGVVITSDGPGPTCGTCNTSKYVCKKGCRHDAAMGVYTEPSLEPSAWCEEGRPSDAGDAAPCEETDTCGSADAATDVLGDG